MMLAFRSAGRTPLVMSGLLLLAAACGSEGSEEFIFTPVPYTVFAERQCESISCSTSYYLREDCAWIAADQVQVIVQAEERDDFVSWMSERKFLIAEEYNKVDDHTVVMLLAVPLGSVPEAVAAIAERPGVVFADVNELVFSPESVPGFVQDCRKTRAAGE